MIYLYIAIAINLISFIVYGCDKFFAIQQMTRVSEKFLLLIALFGGSFGAINGIIVFKHKTNKLKFRVLIPLFLVTHVTIILVYYFKIVY